MHEFKQLQKWISESRSMVFFGGAGVSTESGIPDFRSVDGLYHQQYTHPPETILSHAFFKKYPEDFFTFYREKMLKPVVRLGAAMPNAAHKALAHWEQEGRLRAVITQNIDGLHQKAGSQRVYELHGSVHRNHCLSCGRAFGPETILRTAGIPRCPCGGIIKPDVVLYGESLDQETLERSVEVIEKADLLLVGGTSLSVYPAAGLIRYYGGKRLVLINRSATGYDDLADLRIDGNIGEVLDAVRRSSRFSPITEL